MVGTQSVSVLFRFQSILGRLSVFCALSLGRLGIWFFQFQKFLVWTFLKKNAVFEPVVLWPFLGLLCSLLLSLFQKPVLGLFQKPILSQIQAFSILAIFGTFLGIHFGPNLGLSYFVHFQAFFRNLFWLFLGLFQEFVLAIFGPFYTSIKHFTNKKKSQPVFAQQKKSKNTHYSRFIKKIKK